jgi:hypothetical protein
VVPKRPSRQAAFTISERGSQRDKQEEHVDTEAKIRTLQLSSSDHRYNSQGYGHTPITLGSTPCISS